MVRKCTIVIFLFLIMFLFLFISCKRKPSLYEHIEIILKTRVLNLADCHESLQNSQEVEVTLTMKLTMTMMGTDTILLIVISVGLASFFGHVFRYRFEVQKINETKTCFNENPCTCQFGEDYHRQGQTV